jgi:hypothetical protein
MCASGAPDPGSGPTHGEGSTRRVWQHLGRPRRDAHRQSAAPAARVAPVARLQQRDRERAGHDPSRYTKREALARCIDGSAMGGGRHVGGKGGVPTIESLPSVPGSPSSADRAPTSPSRDAGIACPTWPCPRTRNCPLVLRDLPDSGFLLKRKETRRSRQVLEGASERRGLYSLQDFNAARSQAHNSSLTSADHRNSHPFVIYKSCRIARF